MSTKKQINRFILVGIGAVLIDFLTYKIFLVFLTFSFAKTLSFMCGACFAYVANKFFTFEKREYCKKEIRKFVTLYLATLVANVMVNKLSLVILFTFQKWLMLEIFSEAKSVFLAFLAATSTSTILNFIGQKFWVFKSHSS